MPVLTTINPASGRAIGTFRSDTRRDVEAKFQTAARGAKKWAALPLRERLAAIRRFRAAIISRREALASILTKEVGKPISQSRNELKSFIERIDYFLAEAPGVLRPEIVRANPSGGLVERIVHEPIGIIANISAWNYPYFVGGNVFIPALLTGNAVLYKPSEFAVGTGVAIANLLHESGVPRAAFVPVIGGAEAGEALVDQPVDGVFFTGSSPTGRSIAARLGDRLVRLQLELGGKDPIYVCDDVDISSAAPAIADGAFYNTGQSCCSVERIYVHHAVYAEFVTAFVSAVKGFTVGDPADEACYIGPLARAAQIKVLEKQVSDALRKGARLLAGGQRIERPGNYFEPTVLVDVTHDMRVMRDESFGPIIGIMRVRDAAAAVRLMNDSEYGLTAGVYSRSLRRATSILQQVEAGSVYWNCCDRVSPRLPWTGVKKSGIGVTLSRQGILAFTRPKAWHLREHP